MGKYDGIHTFLFIPCDEDAEAKIAEIVRRKGPVDPENGPLHFASVLEPGRDYCGFAHLSRPTPAEMGALIAEDLWEAGIRSDYETEGVVHTNSSGVAMGPKRRSPRYCAICRVWVVDRPLQVLRAIAERWGEQDPFIGGSQLLRRSRLLIELGDEDRGALDEHIEVLRGIAGVADVKYGVADTGPAAA